MRIGAVRPERAVREHAAFVRALRALGAEVREVPFVHGSFDSVFSKDSAVLVARARSVTALLARPRYPVRGAEQASRSRALAAIGVRVAGQASVPLEGGDVVMAPGARGAFLGHGFRSDARAARDLERFLERTVTCVELRDPRLYHLDMALSVLDDGTALLCEEALTTEARRAVARHPAVRRVIAVPRSEALGFGTNVVQVGRTVVCAADAPATKAALTDAGYRVRRLRLDQFHLAGGSAACLVARVHARAEVALEIEPAPTSTAA